MRKIFAALMVFVLSISMVACTDSAVMPVSEITATVEATPTPTPEVTATPTPAPTATPTPTPEPEIDVSAVNEALQGTWKTYSTENDIDLGGIVTFKSGKVSSQLMFGGESSGVNEGTYLIGQGIIELTYLNGTGDENPLVYTFENDELTITLPEAGIIYKKQDELNMTPQELDSLFATQPLTITGTEYYIQDEYYKSLYPDLLMVTLKNNSEEDIRDARIGFVAWDSNGLPVGIIYQYSNSAEYMVEAEFPGINLVPEQSTGGEDGLSLDEQCDNIATFKAIVVSYNTFGGVKWENPYIDAFRALYENKKFPS